ncbi:MAG TPA: metal ABC transporter substrate-binding protein [Chthoniobacteraceae bacterium]|jgi:ABC-type Zn uptake system ZnuABC Zn-binding protein ZnuA|nr:metal ABC transporter substrate-binding protein [Chthoniobacteraceae bacterium]
MKTSLLTTLVAAVLAVTGHAAPLKVVTTIPDLAEFVRKVGGDQVDVFAIASGREDPHNVPMRPSAITRLQQADLLIVMGLDLEHAYMPAMRAESRNARIQAGGSGFLDLSGGVRVLEVPKSLDRSEGDVHPNGNPHYNTDPVQGQMMVRVIADKLSELAPASAAKFKANAAVYSAQLGAKIPQWRAKIGGKGIKFVSYHPDLIYFAARFGLQQVGTIQPKPGIEPGPRYIDELAARMQSEGVKLIVKESFYSDRVPNELAKRTGARVVSVPILVNGTKDAGDYIAMIDAIVNAFASAK